MSDDILEATCKECGNAMRFTGYMVEGGYRCYSFQCDHCTKYLSNDNGTWPLMAVGQRKIRA